MQNRNKIRRKFILEGLVALIVAISPIAFYSYKYMPGGVDLIDLYLFEISSNGFEDASTAAYFYLTKIIPLLLLVVWFITNKNWWYHAILIPISMYSFQLFMVLQSPESPIDENEVFYIVAVTMVIVPVVYFIRIKLVDKYVHGIDLKAMDTELQILKEKEELRKEREKLEQRKETLEKKL